MTLLADVSLRLSGDLSLVESVLLGALVLTSLGLLFFEARRARQRRALLFASGALGALFLALAVARPVRLEERGQKTGARVVVLVDGSERLRLPAEEGKTRRERARVVVDALRRRFEAARLEVFSFGEGDLEIGDGLEKRQKLVSESDLSGSIEAVGRLPGDRAAQIVVVTDGRLAAPSEIRGDGEEQARRLFDDARGQIPVHVVGLTSRVPRDVAIRSVKTAGSAVAHQPLGLTVELGCEPRDSCPRRRVVVRELLEGEGTLELARGEADFNAGQARLELPITIERAGSRVLEVAFVENPDDEVPANDRRFLTIDVRRDRIRILHVAGRPTYDVRALRMFLKGDESIDLISFFILRTLADRVGAPESELALIPFPVEELFTEHLPSFDAIILQDIDAREYDLDRHFEGMRDYVRRGGGLILVGGPGAFAGGGYAASPLEEVMPVHVPPVHETFSQKPLVPRPTRAGLVAPMLAGLRERLGDRLPQMAGANLVGAAKESALVLWEHPELEAVGKAGTPMPLLSLAEMGDGRSIALALDATHELRFGEEGAETAGRGHTALWEGLLGWLMRDPRFEAARIDQPERCFAGHPTRLEVTPLPGMGTSAEMTLAPLAPSATDSGVAMEPIRLTKTGAEGKPITFEFPALGVGGYVARARVGLAPPTRLVFACEEGGGALSDSRPDPERLRRIAEWGSGKFVEVDGVDSLPEPPATLILASSATVPLAPDWVWSLAAAVLLGLHFLLRRSGGFS